MRNNKNIGVNMLKQVSVASKLNIKTPHREGQPVALVDIDDVIYPCTQILLDYLNDKYRANVLIDDMQDVQLHKLFPQLGRHNGDTLAFLQKFDYMNQPLLYTYVPHLFEVLRYYGFYVAVVTHRGFHPKGYSDTFNFLHRNNLEYDALAVLGLGTSKIEFVLDHIADDLDLVIEDSASVIQEAQEDPDTFVIKSLRAWNSHIETHGTICSNRSVNQNIEEVRDVLLQIKNKKGL